MELDPETEENHTLSLSVFLIICVLLALSIFFELIKVKLYRSVSKSMEKVLEVLFAELTVLGFLSLTTFVVVRANLLALLSKAIFPMQETGEDELAELVETVHFDLFLVMVIFVTQTVVLIQLCESYLAEWKRMEDVFRDFDRVQAHREYLATHYSSNKNIHWWEFSKKAKLRFSTRLFEYISLMKEFVQGRNVLPPFDTTPEKDQLPRHFTYSEYLRLCLAEFMAEIIEMTVPSWLFLSFFLLVFLAIMYLSLNNEKLLTWSWLVLGYSLMGVLEGLRRQARWRIEMCINPLDVPSPSNNFDAESISYFHSGPFIKQASSSVVTRKVSDVSLNSNGPTEHETSISRSLPQRKVSNSSLNGITSVEADDSTPLLNKNTVIVGKTVIVKEFQGGHYQGLVTRFDDPYYLITYEDGDVEEMESHQITKLIASPELCSSLARCPNSWYASLVKGLNKEVVYTTPDEVKKQQPWRLNSFATFTTGKFRGKEVDFHTVPGWCNLAVKDEGRRPFWRKFMFGAAANRQMMLYYFQSKGPASTCFSIRIVCFMHTVYLALLWVKFYAEFMEIYENQYFFIIYVVIGVIPSLFFISAILPTIRDTAHASSIGCFRERKYVAKVLRDMKMASAVKSLLLLMNLQEQFSKKPPKCSTLTANMMSSVKGAFVQPSEPNPAAWRLALEAGEDTQKIVEEIKDMLGQKQFDEAGQLFDMYDEDGGGSINLKELGGLMKSLGKVMGDSELQHVMKILDVDGNGDISKQEFLLWYAEQKLKQKTETPESIAKALFSYFDDDGSGKITASEFMDKLVLVNVGLTVDEITDLIRELDEDNSGYICEEEFEVLLKKHSNLLE